MARRGRTIPGGQPHYSALAILTGLCLQAVFRLALRQTEGLTGSIIGLLGLDLAIPDRTILCCRADGLDVPRPQSSPGAGGRHLIVDSTGLKFHGPGEWLVEKHGTRTRRSWRTLHIGLDADTGRIVAAEPTTNEVDDGSRVGPLLDQVAGAVASFTAGGAYDTGAVSAAVAGRHPDAAVIVPPRSTAMPSDTAQTNPTQRDRHLQGITNNGRAGWQKSSGYNKRSRGRGCDRPVQAGHRQQFAFPDRCPPECRDRRRRPRTQPDAGLWAPDLRQLANGQRQVVSLRLPGDFVAPLGLGQLRFPSICAVAALTELETVDAQPLADAGPDCPGLAHAVRVMAHLEAALLGDQIVRFGWQTAGGRFAHLMLELHGRLSRVGLAGDGRFALPLTQHALADVLGFSVVHVNRTLQQLRRDRLLDVRDGRVVLMRPARLQELAGWTPPAGLAALPCHGPAASEPQQVSPVPSLPVLAG